MKRFITVKPLTAMKPRKESLTRLKEYDPISYEWECVWRFSAWWLVYVCQHVNLHRHRVSCDKPESFAIASDLWCFLLPDIQENDRRGH